MEFIRGNRSIQVFTVVTRSQVTGRPYSTWIRVKVTVRGRV